MGNDPVIVATVRGSVLELRLNRPEKRNAMNRAMAFELRDHLRIDSGVGAIVFTGDDRAFSSGADLDEGADADPATGNGWYETLDLLAAQRVPVVAAIEGHCLGGGLEIALCCDLRIAGRSARLGTPEITHGHWPGGGGTQRLPRTVGVARAKELILTGQPIDADTALAWGLVNSVVDAGQALTTALDLASIVASRPRDSVAAVKDLTESAIEGTVEDGLRRERARWLDFAARRAADGRVSAADDGS